MSSTTVRNRANTGLVARTINLSDVRVVWQMFETEAKSLINGSGLHVNFNADKALLEVGMMALKNVITQVEITFYIKDTIVRRYVFQIADEKLQAWGPPAGQPPQPPSYPEGTQVRLSVTIREGCREEANKLFQQFGWTTGKQLIGGGKASLYGTFVSGSYAWGRAVFSNPDFEKGTNY